jgi:hypothetical protein
VYGCSDYSNPREVAVMKAKGTGVRTYRGVVISDPDLETEEGVQQAPETHQASSQSTCYRGVLIDEGRHPDVPARESRKQKNREEAAVKENDEWRLSIDKYSESLERLRKLNSRLNQDDT